MLVLLGFLTDLHAEEITLLTPKRPPAASKTLSFPPAQGMGNLYLEPESGPGWDPERVGLRGQWEYLGAAQGDVLVPEDRDIKLFVRLALSLRESARMRAQNPLAHQLTIANRTRKDPGDLSGLSELDPNDLFWLSVCTEMYGRTGADPQIFEPIRRLTGLRILTLSNSGITGKGLEHLRPLRSLRGLELTQFPIRSRGLTVLKELPALEYLSLNTGLTDAGLKQVAQVSSLRWLRIGGGRMWGPGLAELAKLPRLERLCFWAGRGGSPISDRHIKYLEGLTQLKGLTLHSVDALTNASLASMGKLKSLEELHFIRASPRFTPTGITYLRSLKNLKKVDFSNAWDAQSGDEVIRHLSALPNLESLKGMRYLSAEGMKMLATFRSLKCLQAGLKTRGQGYHGPTGLSYLAGLSSLEELSISSGDTTLSEADLASLEHLSHLTGLLIMGPVTERGLASIGKLKQLERLHLSCFLTRGALNQLNGLSKLQYLKVSARPRRNAAKTDPVDELMLDLSGLKKMKDLSLSGLPLHDGDLTFLKHMPLLENLAIQPDSAFPLTGACLRQLGELRELNRLHVSGLSGCAGGDLACLNNLAKLRSLRLKGDITDPALASLKGLTSLESLRVETDSPIRKQIVNDLTKSHPVIEFIHIEDPWKAPTRPPQQQGTRVNRSRSNRRTPALRRRERR